MSDTAQTPPIFMAPAMPARPYAVNIQTGSPVEAYILPPVPNAHYPSFRGYGMVPADAEPQTLKSLVPFVADQVAKAQAAYSTSGVAGTLRDFKADGVPAGLQGPPSNEIGAELRIAYYLAAASRVASGRKQFGQAKALLSKAQSSAATAASWVTGRVSASGQAWDIGKVESPDAIAKRLIGGAVVAEANGVPQAGQLLRTMAKADYIAGMQDKADEDPGSPMGKLLIGLGLLALVGLAMKR